MIDWKCGHCSPCFTLTNLVAYPSTLFPDQEDRIRRTRMELYTATYSICLTDVKCLKALTNTRVPLFVDKTGEGFYGLINFDIKPDGKLCITDQNLETMGPKVCCEIRKTFPGAPLPSTYEPDPTACKSCCDLLKKALMEPPLRHKPLCEEGQYHFDVPTTGGSASVHDVRMALYDVIRALLRTKWNRFINDFDSGDALAKLYDSADWSTCLQCPERCC